MFGRTDRVTKTLHLGMEYPARRLSPSLTFFFNMCTTPYYFILVYFVIFHLRLMWAIYTKSWVTSWIIIVIKQSNFDTWRVPMYLSGVVLGFLVPWADRFLALQFQGILGLWVLGLWVSKSLGLWVSGSLGFWVSGFLFLWVSGSLGFWVLGFSLSMQVVEMKELIFSVLQCFLWSFQLFQIYLSEQ